MGLVNRIDQCKSTSRSGRILRICDLALGHAGPHRMYGLGDGEFVEWESDPI